MISLAYDGTTLELTDRLVWRDEFAWSPVVQAIGYSTTGKLLVDIGVKQAGRPITLEGQESAAWITRETCVTLEAWVSLPGIDMVLTLRGQMRDVKFDQERGGFEAKPLWRLLDGEETATQIFIPTLRFIEV